MHLKVLTGKVNEKTIFDKNDHRASRKKEWINEAMKKIEKMKPFLGTKGWAMSQSAVKFDTIPKTSVSSIAYRY